MPAYKWTLLHDIAYVYLGATIPQTGDNTEMLGKRMKVIIERLLEWTPDKDKCGPICMEVMNVIRTLTTDNDKQGQLATHEKCLAQIKKHMPHNLRPAVISDLRRIANSTHSVQEDEENIRSAANALEVPI
jgi:hypothetical protein